MTQLLVTAFYRSVIMIGPGGLLSVVPHLLASPVSVLWVSMLKKKEGKITHH